MQSKNCPNCAAPYDVALNKCPYCGTSYFDMSCIDITGDEPFYLKLKMNGHTFISRVLARPEAEICISDDNIYAYDHIGMNPLMAHISRSMDIDLHFISAPLPNGNLFRIDLEESE